MTHKVFFRTRHTHHRAHRHSGERAWMKVLTRSKKHTLALVVTASAIICLLGFALGFFLWNSLRPIDNAIVPTASGEYAYTFSAQQTDDRYPTISFSKNSTRLPTVSMQKGSVSLEVLYVPQFADAPVSNKAYATSIKGKQITFHDVEKATNLVYTVENGHVVKEDIELVAKPEVIDEKSTTYTFDMTLSGLEITKKADGSVAPDFLDPTTGERYAIPPLIMTDKEGQSSMEIQMVLTELPGSGNSLINTQMSTVADQTTQPIRLRAVVRPNPAWLSAPDRVYPVRIDPTLSWSQANWWDETYGYRQTVAITNSSGSDLTDYQTMFTLDTASLITAGKMQSDCDDIRITDVNGKELPYWIEENSLVCNSSATGIWIKYPTIPSTGAIAFVYYGNSGASKKASGENTFQFFDNFSDSSINSAFSYGGGTITESGGIVSAINNSDAWDTYFYTTDTYTRTRSMQARFRASSGVRSMIGWHDSGTGASYVDFPYALYFNNGTLYVYEDGTSKGVVGSGYTVGTWYDVKIDVLSTGAVYSIKATTATSWTTLHTSTYSSEDNLKPGFVHYDSTAGEISDLDDLFIKKYVASEPTAAISGSEELSPAPIAYWKFDEGYGTTANNSGIAGTNGTLVNSPAWSDDKECLSGKCLRFDGVNDNVSVGTGNTYFPLSTLSICSWIRTPGIALGSSMTSQGFFSLTYGLIMYLGSNGSFATTMDNGTSSPSMTVSGNFADGKWHHMCLTYDGTNRYMYVDGMLRGTQASTWLGTTRWPTNAVNIGYNNNNSGATRFNGWIDETKMWRYPLSSDQIRNEFVARGGNSGSQAQFGYPPLSQAAEGLVGYWKMDEASWSGTANEVVDSSGKALHGTRVGNATTGAGKFGNGGTYDGSGDYVTLGAPFSQATFTVSAWVKPAVSEARTIFDARDSASDGMLFGLNSTGKFRFRLDGSDIDTAASYSTGVWQHYTATYDGTNVRLYINGVLDTTYAQSNAMSVTTNAAIGALSYSLGSTADHYSGQMDELRVYNRALSPNEVGSLYEFAPGPMGWWKMDETSGTRYDSSGNGKNLTDHNSTLSEPGKFGAAASFSSSSSQYLSAPAGTDYSMGDKSYTISTWLRLGSDAADQVFVAKDNGSSAKEYNLWYYSVDDTLNFQMYNGASVTVGRAISEPISLNTWYFVTAGYDATLNSAFIQVNSEPRIYDTLTGSPGTNSTILTVGSRGDPAIYLTGQIDDLKIHNYVRTPAQIVEDMNGGHPTPGSPVGSALGHWKFDEGYGTTANNSGSGGSTLNGTITGATWTNDGKLGKALSFDGSGDYVDSTVNSTLDEGTVCAWIQTSSSALQQIYSQNVITGNAHFDLSIGRWGNSNKLTFGIWDGSTIPLAISTTTITDGDWHHVCGVRNNAINSVYVDGLLEHSISNGNTTQVGTLVSIGRNRITDTSYFTGKIDEVKIYDIALTEDQVKAEYNQGKAQVMGSIGTESNGTTPSFSSSREHCVPGDTSTCNPPIAEWKFDENTGATISDTSGSGYTGNLGETSGAEGSDPTWSAGKIGSSLLFDGTDDTSNFGNILNLGTSDRTYSAWFKLSTTSLSANAYILSKTDNGSTAYRQALGFNTSSQLYTIFRGASNSNYDNTITISLDTNWHHVAWSIDRSSVYTLYLDGVNVGTKSISAIEANNFSLSRPFRIGSANTTADAATAFFPGRIDNVRVYDYARTPAQIAWEYNQGAPIAWYKMDECQGTTIYNSALNGNGDAAGNNGTLTIGASGTNTTPGTCAASGAWNAGATGKINSSMSFDNTDDYISIADDSTKLRPKNVSIGAWFKLAGSPSYETVVSKPYTSAPWSSPYISWLLRINSSTSIEMDVGNGTTYSATSFTVPTLSTGVWYHALFTYDGTTLTAYLNGNKIGTNTAVSGDIGYAAQPILIGADHGASPYGDYFNGQIDDVRIYSYALTSAQVRDVYNNGAVSFK